MCPPIPLALAKAVVAITASLTISTFSVFYGRTRYQKIDKEIIKGYLALSTWLFLVILAVCIIIDSFVTCEGLNWRAYQGRQKIPWC